MPERVAIFLYEMPTTTFFFFLPLVEITENLLALPTTKGKDYCV
jgi:hypothetical protein